MRSSALALVLPTGSAEVDVPGGAGTEATTEQMISRQREEIAHLRGRLESLSAVSPPPRQRVAASGPTASPRLDLPEGVPTKHGSVDADTDVVPEDAREAALVGVQRKRAGLLDNADDAEQAAAKLQLVQRVEDWLS